MSSQRLFPKRSFCKKRNDCRNYWRVAAEIAGEAEGKCRSSLGEKQHKERKCPTFLSNNTVSRCLG